MRTGVAVALILLSSCSRKEASLDSGTPPTTTPAPEPPPLSTPAVAKASPPAETETLAPDAAAKDTASAIRSFHPVACRAASANNAWATCHDETKGYDRVLACAKQAREKARAAKAQLPRTTPASVCGRDVATASSEMVTASALLFDKLVTWLEANRRRLSGPMANHTLSEACDDVDCADLPSEFSIENASYARVSGIECTKTLFQCGFARDNVCWINKVASRLGVACDQAENKTSDPLNVRGTGRQVN